MKRVLAAALLSGSCSATGAAALDHLEVGHDDERYRLRLAMRIDAPLQASFDAFSDYRLLPQINDAVENVELLSGAPPGQQRVATRVRVCVWLFCTHLNQVQDLRKTVGPHQLGLDAEVMPERSNLRYGRARWRMRDCDGQTCLGFDAELEPDFWVPPLIGPWAIERAMRREAVQTALGIERLAAQRSAAAAP